MNEASVENAIINDSLWHLSVVDLTSVEGVLHSVDNSRGNLSESEFFLNIISDDWFLSVPGYWHLLIGSDWFSVNVLVHWVVARENLGGLTGGSEKSSGKEFHLEFVLKVCLQLLWNLAI